MNSAGPETLRERLTVCPLILPVLNLPALLVGFGLDVGLGVDVVGMIADSARFALTLD